MTPCGWLGVRHQVSILSIRLATNITIVEDSVVLWDFIYFDEIHEKMFASKVLTLSYCLGHIFSWE